MKSLLNNNALFEWKEKLSNLMSFNMAGQTIALFSWPEDFWEENNEYMDNYDPVTTYQFYGVPLQGLNPKKTKKHLDNHIYIAAPRIPSLDCFQSIGAGIYISQRKKPLVWIHKTTAIYIPYLAPILKNSKKAYKYHIIPYALFKGWLSLSKQQMINLYREYEKTLPAWPTLTHPKPWKPEYDRIDKRLLTAYRKKYPNGLKEHDNALIQQICPSYYIKPIKHLKTC